MSLLLVLFGLLISSTHSFYYVLTDSSGTLSYMAQITTKSTNLFDLILYNQSPYSSSPICADCIIFNGTLKTYNIPISKNTISIHIKSDLTTKSSNIYIFIQCPLLLTISIALPSHHIEYTQNPQIISNDNPNTDEFHCVFQEQDESLDTVSYVMYNKPNQISLYQYYLPMKSNIFKNHIVTPFTNTSINSYIVYCNDMLYFITLSSLNHDIIVLTISSYNFIDRIWARNDDIFSEIQFNTDININYAGIHIAKHTQMSILNIFLQHQNQNKYEIISWLIDTDIYSIHQYMDNNDNNPIVINDYNINLILSPIINHDFIYYNKINSFLKQLSFSSRYIKLSSFKRRRLQRSDPECQDVSIVCPDVKADCDDEGIKDLCRDTCGQCQQRPFNCSDYVSSDQTVEVCQFAKESPSFCADPDGWFLYFCPVTCHHPNCTQQWMTMNPTLTPTLRTTTFDSTEISNIPSVQTTTLTTEHHITTPLDTPSNIPSNMPSVEMTTLTTKKDLNIPTDPIKTNETDIESVVIKPDKTGNDMSLILILLAVLLICIFVAGILLWLLLNIIRLQKDRNHMSYNAMAAMSSRTPDFYTHGGGAPSTPDYYRTDIRHRDPFQRG